MSSLRAIFAAPPQAGGTPTEALRVPAFRRLWEANIITVIGAQLTVVAVPAQIYAITRSSAYVGLTGAFGLVPLIFFGLYGGALADVMDRRRLMMITTVGLIATSAAFFVQALLGLENVWLLLLIFAVQQAFFAINQPTRSAILPRIIPTRQLPAANSLNMTVMQFGAIAGPLVGGALIPLLGYSVLYLVDIIAMVFGMPRALFPQIAHQSFGGPVDGGIAFALLFAGIPAGAVIGGVFSGWVSRTSRQGYAVICAIVVWGIAMAGFGVAVGLSHGSMGVMLVFALLALVVGGAADMASAAFRNAMLQEAASDDVRGRLQESSRWWCREGRASRTSRTVRRVVCSAPRWPQPVAASWW